MYNKIRKCSICGREQKKIENLTIGNNKISWPMYDPQILTVINNKCICNNCMDIYHKIYALDINENFSCRGREYYADGRNLK